MFISFEAQLLCVQVWVLLICGDSKVDMGERVRSKTGVLDFWASFLEKLSGQGKTKTG